METYTSFNELAKATATSHLAINGIGSAVFPVAGQSVRLDNATHHPLGDYGIDLYIEKYPIPLEDKNSVSRNTSIMMSDPLTFFGNIPAGCTKFSDKGLQGDILYSTGNGNEVAVGFKNKVNLSGFYQLPDYWYQHAEVHK
jgi:hypothetical protein